MHTGDRRPPKRPRTPLDALSLIPSQPLEFNNRTERLIYIAQGFANGELADEIGARMGYSEAWVSIFVKDYGPRDMRGKMGPAKIEAAKRFLSGSCQAREDKPPKPTIRRCKQFQAFKGRPCGLPVKKGRHMCRECWKRSIPGSYEKIMTPLEYHLYLKTY